MIVGTAGHIDHGKTALLKALTGQSGDRRREERERGITIDLGFIYAVLEPGAALTGFIDVPGHERFIHNMLAGIQGIDLVLLVVAADDGVMSQTREHLAIIELLGIPRALVAISKCDRVNAARVRAVQVEVETLLAPGPYAGAQQIVLSSVTGEGIETLRQALLDAQREIQQRIACGGFRLAIDRAFSVAGTGIVVTGTALAGQVTVGDTLLLGASGKPVRVRGLHAQNQAAVEGSAGQRLALNLSAERLALEQIHRGDWLLAEWLYAPTQRLDIDMQLLASETRTFTHFSPVHVHLGTQDVTARVALLEGESLAPGHRMFAQLLVNAPLQAVQGDHLVLRDQSAQRTLGGGRVLDPFAPARQRRSPARLAQLQALADTNTLEQVLPTLFGNSDAGLDPQRLERQFNRLRATWQLPADILVIATRQGPRLFSDAHWQALKARVLEQLARFHQLEPDQLGPDRDRLRRFAGMSLDRPTFISLLDELLAGGAIAASGPWLHLPEHQVRLSEEDEVLWLQLKPLFEQAGFDSPWVRDLANATHHDEAAVRLLLRKLARLGQVHQVVRDLFYTDATVRQLAAMLLQLSADNPVIPAAAFRDAVGIGRKRSIQILEFFDRIGLTRRLGDQRRIRPDNALAQSS
ncbi:selenocysteine-specific translation elongation factor [Pseudomonas sp. MH9.2]|uniref:selenocysteine-specific translation elongation factor n=1 Tax=unclassified Pseudomonas TaxID=196821 RepID=UPI002AC92FD0|nr:MULTISPECIES: selenocysteine-specific translation elongation factor [unclassified Pseudomonas]MEB0006668.1 selenocysteine-specific translation elongation factor [Pseudomonas sp. RTB2]MEB0016006.1 selenocysteine-specific translation elongation factor [Pseudomonas sp. RTB3]MEB0025982.1 selenocysteine-specific translation elongation factor [Pseudomonas sp. MH9.2]MEB0146131.1 selenocysteine-specific translation elongation factor [Pseudomonas sp. CCC2.2]MEB0271312.1 selenocysteine-specific trans